MDTVDWIISWERFVRDETGEIYELTENGWIRCSFFRMEDVVCASNPGGASFEAQVKTVEALRRYLPEVPGWFLQTAVRTKSL